MPAERQQREPCQTDPDGRARGPQRHEAARAPPVASDWRTADRCNRRARMERGEAVRDTSTGPAPAAPGSAAPAPGRPPFQTIVASGRVLSGGPARVPTGGDAPAVPVPRGSTDRPELLQGRAEPRRSPGRAHPTISHRRMPRDRRRRQGRHGRGTAMRGGSRSWSSVQVLQKRMILSTDSSLVTSVRGMAPLRSGSGAQVG
jgi:hypothetical protein